jgi:hypothetical protein
MAGLWRAQQRVKAMQRTLNELRPRCGYTKHTNGKPCRIVLEPGQRHCRTHDVGPKTPEGRERIRQAQLRRWEKWRQERAAAD